MKQYEVTFIRKDAYVMRVDAPNRKAAVEAAHEAFSQGQYKVYDDVADPEIEVEEIDAPPRGNPGYGYRPRGRRPRGAY